MDSGAPGGNDKKGIGKPQKCHSKKMPSNMEENDDDSRPQKRKRTGNLSKGPTMMLTTPSDYLSKSETASVPDRPSPGTIVNSDLVIELQHEEEKQSKELTSQTMQQLSNLSNAGFANAETLQSMHKKIKEYQDAVNQRDNLMGELQSRLGQLIQERDELLNNSQEQEQRFQQEIQTLKKQLQQAIDMVANQKTGVNPRDHLELKNKLISVQQERSEQETTIQDLKEQLELRIESHGQLDYKYKQILQKFKLKDQELEKTKGLVQSQLSEKDSLAVEIERMKEEHRQLVVSLEAENASCMASKRKLEDEKSSVIGENNQMRREIQELMAKLQEMSEEMKRKEEQINATQAHADEHFGVQITLIKQQMSDLHAEEISKIKNTHSSEVARITEEIDSIQETHRENLNSQNAIIKSLKLQLESEKLRSQQVESEKKTILRQLEDAKLSRDCAVEDLRRVQSECTEASNRLSESEQQFGELKRAHEDLVQKEKDWISERASLVIEVQSIQTLKTEITNLQGQLQVAQHELKSKEKNWLAEKELLAKEVSDVEILKDEITKLEEEVKVSMEIEKECALLKEEKNALNQKCAELGSQVQGLSLENKKLGDEVTRSKEETDKLNELLQHETKENAGLAEECKGLKEELNKSGVKCSELGLQIESLTNEKVRLEEERGKHKAEIENLNLMLKDEMRQKEELVNQCEYLKQEHSKCQEETNRLSKCIESSDTDKKTELNQKYTELELQVEGLTKEKKQFENECVRLKEALSELDRKCEDMKVQRDDAVAESSRLHLRIKDLETEKGNSEELRNCVALLEGKCKEAKEAKEEYERQCLLLNEKLASLDKKLAEAHKLHVDFDATTGENSSLKKKLREASAAVDQYKAKLSESELSLKQLKGKFEKIEKDKADIEVERDKLMEQYKMMNAELSSTMLALDREIQLTTHRRLSDIGSSISRGDLATQTDEVLSEGDSEKDTLIEEMNISLPTISAKENEDPHQHISDLEKEIKDLSNEAEKLKNKVKEQSFNVKSLENKNSSLRRRLQELEAEKLKLKEELKDNQNVMLEKLECQRQLTELKLSKNMQEQNWRQLERNVNVLVNTVKDSRDIDMKEELSKTIGMLEVSFSESQLQDTFNSSHLLDVLDQSQEFECLKSELNRALSKVLSNFDEFDRLTQEKLEMELENIGLKARLNMLESMGSKVGRYSREDHYSNDHSKSLVEEKSKLPENLEPLEEKSIIREKSIQGRNEYIAAVEELQMSKSEILRLQRDIERQRVLFELERQHLQAPKLKIQVHSIMQNVGESLDTPLTIDSFIDGTIKFLSQAILKTVSGDYLQILSKTVTQLEDAIVASLRKPSLEISSSLTHGDSFETGPIEYQGETTLDKDIRTFTGKVEQLVHVRMTLVDSANELVEQLEEAVTQRLSPLKIELEDLLKRAPHHNLSSSVVRNAATSKLQVESYNEFIQEFVEVTTNITEEAQGEKLQILQNQQALIQKILEDDKSKLSSLGREHIQQLETVNSLPEAIQSTKDLVASLESTLGQEVTWVKQVYKELLNQYSYEQELKKKTHTSKLKELEGSLASLLEAAPLESELAKLTSSHKAELNRLQEEHESEVKRLENKITIGDDDLLMALDEEALRFGTRADCDPSLASESCLVSDNIKIEVTQQHLQSLYSDRDWYRRTVSLLSNVTLELLHYFTVAESYIKPPQKCQGEDIEHHEEGTFQALPEFIPGVVKDLSFLSDCKTDYINDNAFSIFPEDSAVSTALISKSIPGERSEELEMASSSGSMLDSTVLSEGLLEDMDKDEQVRSLLTKFYPQLMSILKGRWDRIVVESLEKEVQKLTIALQASAGMLKIFMHSISEHKSLPPHPVSHEIVFSKEVIESHSRISCRGSLQAIDDGSSHASDYSSIQYADLPKAHGAEQVQNSSMECQLLTPEAVHSNISSQIKDLTLLAQDLTLILSQEETVLSFAMVKTPRLDTKDKVKSFLKDLCKMVEQIGELQLQIHRQEGLIRGLEEEGRNLREENGQLSHDRKNLAMELEVTKNQLADYELEGDKKAATSPSYAEKMEASKDTKEKVRAVLSAKAKSTMDRSELVTRNGELERLLESFVRDYDKDTENWKLKVADLSQQLEAADRQIRSNRQFIDEQANERERERDEMQKEKDKLSVQLRERDNLQLHHDNMSKEVESLERELRERNRECEEALLSLRDFQVDQKAAHDKISDQRDIISDLEAQLDSRNKIERDLGAENEALLASCEKYKKEIEEFRSKLEEEHRKNCDLYAELSRDDAAIIPQVAKCDPADSEDSFVHHEGGPLSLELWESSPHDDSQVEQNQPAALLKYLERISDCLTSLLDTDVSTSQIESDLSGRNHLGNPSTSGPVESERTVSPAAYSSLSLEERLADLECTAEAAVKRMHDMQMTERNLRESHEELMEEKNLIQERMEKHGMEVASLEARLDEFRRLDYPQCTELQQKITSLSEEIEKLRSDLIKVTLKNEEYKHSLSEMRETLKSREAEMERLQRDVSKSSPEMDAKYKQLLEELHSKEKQIKELRMEKNTSAAFGGRFSHGLERSNVSSCSLEELRRDFSQESLSVYPHLTASNKLGPSHGSDSNILLVSSSSSQPDPSLLTLESTLSKDPQSSSNGDGVTPMKEDIATKESSKALDEKEPVTLSGEEYHSLSSALEEVSLLKVENELLKKEVCSLNQYQTKLEEDFKSAQQLLKSQEEEIMQLTEEMVDGVPQPLPSETLHLQQTCQQLEDQLSSLQIQYEGVCQANEEYRMELERYSKDYQQLQQQMEKLKSENDLLTTDITIKSKALEKLEESRQVAVRELSAKESALQDELIRIQKQLEKEKQEVQIREFKIIQQSHQIDTLHKDLAEKSSIFSAHETRLEKHRTEISDLKSEHDHLIGDYQKELATQRSVSEKLESEKVAIAHQLEIYELKFVRLEKEKENAQQRVQELEQQLNKKQLNNSNLQYSHLSDSLRDLSEGVREQLNKSSRLDSSLVSYMTSGLEGSESVQPSTRASSVGDETEEGSIHTQVIVNKVQQESIQTLSSRERLSDRHSSPSERTDKVLSSATGSERSSEERSVAKRTFLEQPQYVRRIAELEQIVSEKEKVIRRTKLESNFYLEQERMISEDAKLSLEDARKRNRELSDQLRQERKSNYDYLSDNTFLKSQIDPLRFDLQKVQEENYKLHENNAFEKERVETLTRQLQSQRNNFSIVTAALDDQRKIAKTTKITHDKLVKDLQTSLREERKRSEKLLKDQKVNILNLKTISKDGETLRPEIKKMSHPSSLEDLQTRLAIETERVTDLERKYERERATVANLKEQADIERSHTKSELMSEQAKTADLRAKIKNIEQEKDKLTRLMNQDKEQLTKWQLKARELEDQVSKLESKLEAQTAAHEVASHKAREEDAQFLLNYDQTLKKLEDAKAEVCALKQENRQLKKDLEVVNSKCQSLEEDLKSERAAINRLGLPALARTNNFNEFIELNVKENIDLYKLVMDVMDDKFACREKITSLESQVQELTRNYTKANSALSEFTSLQKNQRRRIDRYESERKSLIDVISKKDSELQLKSDSYAFLYSKVHNIYAKELKLKSKIRNLVYQKNYLIKVVKDFNCSEEYTVSRMRNMVQAYSIPSTSRSTIRPQPSSSLRKSRHTLRTVTLAIVAITRMKNLVRKWQSNTLLDLQGCLNIIPPDSFRSIRDLPLTGAIGGDIREPSTRALDHTPPTKEPRRSYIVEATHSTSSRSLFVDHGTRENGRDLGEFIDRLDNIHSQFGINVKK